MVADMSTRLVIVGDPGARGMRFLHIISGLAKVVGVPSYPEAKQRTKRAIR